MSATFWLNMLTRRESVRISTTDLIHRQSTIDIDLYDGTQRQQADQKHNHSLPSLYSQPSLLNEQYTYYPTLTPERNSKLIFTIGLIISLIALFIANKHSSSRSVYHMFSYILIILIINWNISLYSIIFSTKHLHKIVIKRRRLDDKSLLFIPYDNPIENKHQVLLSVSAVNAIAGSNAERSSLLTMYISFGVTYCAVSMKWIEQKASDYTLLDMELFLCMLSAVGMICIATWEVEAHPMSICIHYLAAITTIISSPAAFLMQQNYSTLSIIMACLTWIGLVEWLALHTFVIPQTHSDTRLVHTYSKISIINEAIVLTFAYTCALMFIYCLEGDILII
eukprot:20558_1